MQNYKEKGLIVHQFICFCMENHLWKFQPKWTHISWDMNENINKENKRILVLETHTIIIYNFLQWLFLSKFFAIFGFLWHHLTILLPFHLITYSSTFAFYPPTLLPSTFNGELLKRVQLSLVLLQICRNKSVYDYIASYDCFYHIFCVSFSIFLLIILSTFEEFYRKTR